MKGPTRQHHQIAVGDHPDVRLSGPQPKPSTYKHGGMVKPSKYAEGGRVVPDMLNRPSREGKDIMSDRDIREGHFPRSRGYKDGGCVNGKASGKCY